MQWLRKYLPSRQWMILIIVLLMISFIVGILCIVRYHSYAHPFWREHPVAWTQFGISHEGIIQDKVTELQKSTLPKGYPPLPKQLTIQHLQGSELLQPESSSLWHDVALIWKISSYHAMWRCRRAGVHLMLLIDKQNLRQSQPSIVGAELCIPIALHTPHDEYLEGFIINYLSLLPNYRGKGYGAHLIQHAFSKLSAKPGEALKIALFSNQLTLEKPSMNRLPFGAVGRLQRSSIMISPTLLPDSSLGLAHNVVLTAAKLPDRCWETSLVRIQGHATLEPSPDGRVRKDFWEHVIADPHQILLAIEGVEWIHLKYIDPNTIALSGFSHSEADTNKVAEHVLFYLKTHVSKNTIKLVVPSPFISAFSESALQMANSTSDTNEWQLYDIHDIHMYNYILDHRYTHIPSTMNIDML